MTCCIGFTICLGIVANVVGMHDARMPRVLLDLVGRSCLVVGMAMLVFGLLIHLVYYAQVGRYISGYICLFGTVGMIGTRMLVWKMSDTFSQRLTFVGDDKFRFDANSFPRNIMKCHCGELSPIEYDEAESKMPLDIWALSTTLTKSSTIRSPAGSTKNPSCVAWRRASKSLRTSISLRTTTCWYLSSGSTHNGCSGRRSRWLTRTTTASSGCSTS